MSTGIESTSRWVLEGTLTTRSPLHLGSGEVVSRPELKYLEGPRQDRLVEINGVAVDHQGRAYLPATALKAALRRGCEAAGASEELLHQLFGRPSDPNNEIKGLGGIAEVADASLLTEPTFEKEPPSYWDPQRRTAVTARVAIDRFTRTAAHQRLFHDEVVPPGVSFGVEIAGRLSEEAVVCLLAALAGFEDPEEPVTLGADTGNGWGRMHWHPGQIRRLDAAGLRRWAEAAEPAVGWKAPEPLSQEEQQALFARAAGSTASRRSRRLSFDVRLVFDGPFLVNDPWRTRKDDEEQEEKPASADAKERVPDHANLLDVKGNPILPASSFRGALRSQAERILRTVAGDRAACRVGAPRKPCSPPKTREDISDLCPACRLFGAAGWRSPLELTDFTVDKPGTQAGETLRQEFLAIDRFTGGGAPGLKFNAEAFYRTILAGRFTVNLKPLEDARCGPWAGVLVALVLRDLVEGDISFGFGAGKGYGHCTATLTPSRLPVWDELPETWRQKLEKILDRKLLDSDPAANLLDGETELGVALSLIIDEELPQANKPPADAPEAGGAAP